MDYQEINSKVIDSWCKDGWEWGKPISHETYKRAQEGIWGVYLTPTKTVPKDWFGDLKGKKILGLASGGGQQIPVFSALGACCTVLDYSGCQCESELLVAQREGYEVEVIQGDMTKRLPFEEETFDLIFHPVSNCYVEEVKPIFRECFRILKTGGILLCGLDNGINYIFDDETESVLTHRLPYNPLRNPELYEECMQKDYGIQFSHTIEEQVGGQLEAGFCLTHLYEDTNGEGNLHEHGIPSFLATRAVKPSNTSTISEHSGVTDR
ncbi:MAG: class I SAM-dependent methyltransferase [Fusicatenibacter sp.]|nr:class I SAM-dependent methyltransferase [Fusicatenibacter sp.]